MLTEMQLYESRQQTVRDKWKEVLEYEDLPKIVDRVTGKKDLHKAYCVAQVLENTEYALREAALQGDNQFLFREQAPTNSMGTSSTSQGPIQTFDPVLISLVRRAMPNLIAYDICGVQPMTGPTGIVFAMRSRYANQTGGETFYNEVNTGFSTYGGANNFANSTGNNLTGSGQGGNNNPGGLGTFNSNVSPGGAGQNLGTLPGNTTTTSNLAGNSVYNYAAGMGTFFAEGLGANSIAVFPQMAFSIEKVTVVAHSRALQAQYSMELAQDLKAIHGLDAETELSNILSAEILAEINREVIRTVYVTAVPGSQLNVTTPGVFDLDVDSNGRWMVEKFKGMMFQFEKEANQIAKDTRRGKGNIIICTSDVASALQMAGILQFTPGLNGNNLEVDDTGNTFVGVLNNRFRVYIDPYATGGNFAVVGYKGSNAFDAGLFYCPYVPLQMVRAVNPNTYQPQIGFKTRYGIVANPFAQGLTQGYGGIQQDSNLYYRRTIIANIM